MPNLVTGFPRRTGDTTQDVKEFYDWAVSLVDELKQLLNNLDAGNVLEAASVKADNIADLDNFIAEHITAGTIVTNTLIADSLYSDMGSIAELTVDRISTSQAVYKYLAGDLTPDVYFEGYEQGIYFVQANAVLDEVTGEPQTEQLCDRFGNPVWWQKPIVSIVGNIPYDENGDRVLTTRSENTGIKVMVYKYQKNIKLKIEFYTGADGVANPRITLGIGTDPTGNAENGKAFIEKTAEGLSVQYISEGGEPYKIIFKNDGIYQMRSDGESRLPFTFLKTVTPPDTLGRDGDICFVTI